MLRSRFLLPAVFLIAFCIRTPALGLPLEGDGALLAAQAAGGTWWPADAAPLLPALTAVGVSLGASPTAALRWIDAVSTSLLGPLLVLLALLLGVRRSRAAVAGILLALHPLALTGGGGIAPGTGSLAAALLLAAVAGLAAPSRVGARLGALAALLLLAADGAGLLLAPVLLFVYARREPSARIQTVVLMLGAALLVAAPLSGWRWSTGPAPALLEALEWSLGASLGILLVGLPGGFGALRAQGSIARTWLLLTALGAVAALLGGPVPPIVVLPPIALAGVEGLARMGPRWARQLTPAGVGGALVVSMWLVSGGLQAALPIEPAAAGRLHYLREAMRAAAHTAGEDGWIVLAVAQGRPAEQASLADLHPDRWTWAEQAGEGDATAPRRLLVFPAAAFESGRSVAVLAASGRGDGIHTFDGAGIYHEKVVHEVGPYVVLRASRP